MPGIPPIMGGMPPAPPAAAQGLGGVEEVEEDEEDDGVGMPQGLGIPAEGFAEVFVVLLLLIVVDGDPHGFGMADPVAPALELVLFGTVLLDVDGCDPIMDSSKGC